MKNADSEQIEMSVVIAAWNGDDYLRCCLSSLAPQIDSKKTEVIVVANYKSELKEKENCFGFANYVFLSPDSTVPELRSCGIIRARGEVIALTEDFCVFHPEWRRETEKAHEQNFTVVGGAIENSAAESLLNWAVYFYDYGKYMLPEKAGTVETISGANVSYKKEILEQLKKNSRNGFFETFVHEELKRNGHRLYLAPAMIVYHGRNYRWKEIAERFYHQGRSFAARRAAKMTIAKRLLYLIGSLALPFLLTVRILLRTIVKNRNLKELVLSLPWLTVLMFIWSLGEFIGNAAGEGVSGRKWK